MDESKEAHEKITFPLWVFAIPVFLVLLFAGYMLGYFGRGVSGSFEYGAITGVLSYVVVKIFTNLKKHGSIFAKD